MSVNSWTLHGRLGQDPELRTTSSGKEQASFSLAEDVWSGGEKSTAWHNVTCFEGQARSVANYLTKGSEVICEGRVAYDEYVDKNESKQKRAKMIAYKVHFVGSKGAGKDAEKADDSVPF